MTLIFREFSEFTRVNSSFKFTTVNEGLEEYRTKLQIINEKLPLIFPSKMLTGRFREKLFNPNSVGGLIQRAIFLQIA